MAFVIRSAWVSNQAYTAGTVVNFNGVDYSALSAVTSTIDPSQDGTNWEAVAVTRIQDYNSLVEAIRLQLNVRSQDEINNSIPLFIQLTEESYKTRIRAPQQIRTTVLTTDSQGRIQVPGDLLEVINLRLNRDQTSLFGTFGRESIELLAGNYEEFQEIRQYYNANSAVNTVSISQYEAPVYWNDDRYFWIAPTYETGTEIELVYYSTIPQLGDSIMLTNEQGMPINAQGETMAEYLVRVPGGTFVQDTTIVTRNWFTAAVPQLLLYGACLKAAQYLRNESQIQLFAELYTFAEQETQVLIGSFESRRAHTVQIESGYVI